CGESPSLPLSVSVDRSWGQSLRAEPVPAGDVSFSLPSLLYLRVHVLIVFSPASSGRRHLAALHRQPLPSPSRHPAPQIDHIAPMLLQNASRNGGTVAPGTMEDHRL